MFVGITNTPRDYAWGATDAIATALGRTPSGSPEAELWLGAHLGSPAVITEPVKVDGVRDLVEWIAHAPQEALGSDWATATDGVEPRLPFLLKLLAAAKPLSLQAHPSAERARIGFELENAAGVPLDAFDRNYKDPFHKPELIYALSANFEALCGFRTIAEIHRILEELRAIDATTDRPQAEALDLVERRLVGDDALHDVVDWLLRDGHGDDSGEVIWLVERVVELAEQAAFLADGGAHISFMREFDTVRSLAAEYPGDPGIVLSLLLNRVSLKRGEVLYLPAGNIHAYLSGFGVELMAASDNVLRGGLTPKHIDVDELLDVLDFTPLPVPYLPPEVVAPGVSVFRPDVLDFQLVHIEADASGIADTAGAVGVPPMRQVDLAGPAIALCLNGGFLVAGESSSVALKRGESVFITPEEGTVTFAGVGEIFLAMPQ